MTAKHESWLADGMLRLPMLLGLGLMLSIFSRAVLRWHLARTALILDEFAHSLARVGDLLLRGAMTEELLCPRNFGVPLGKLVRSEELNDVFPQGTPNRADLLD